MSNTILIIEDDVELVKLLQEYLAETGFESQHAPDGITGLDLVQQGDYALVVLDLGLPGLGGMEVCKKIRERSQELPLIMLTSRAEEIDRVLGLELGADDYVVKPFHMREFIARVKAIIRRARARSSIDVKALEQSLQFGRLKIELRKRRVIINNEPIRLTPIEFDLLVHLASHPGVPFTREELALEVWGYQHSGCAAIVSTGVNRLRSKIEADPLTPRFIVTVRGSGYRFAELEELAR